jgi:hypothetical protein
MSESDELQEEMGYEAQSEEEYPPPSTIDGLEISNTGWRIKMVRQDDDKVVVKIYCKSEARDWYTLTVRLPKDKLKLVG